MIVTPGCFGEQEVLNCPRSCNSERTIINIAGCLIRKCFSIQTLMLVCLWVFTPAEKGFYLKYNTFFFNVQSPFLCDKIYITQCLPL